MHIQRDHHGADSAARNHIIECTHGFKIREDFPKIELGMELRPSFSGVRIRRDQNGCPRCPYIAGIKAVEKHMHDNQHGSGRKKIRSGLASQVLNAGDCKAQFLVVERLDNEPPADNNGPPNPWSSSPLYISNPGIVRTMPHL
jgi:hypothetical protein